MPGIPTVTRCARRQVRGDAAAIVSASRSGGSGYGVRTRTGGACSVPAASSTEALMPLPPQSTPSVYGLAAGHAPTVAIRPPTVVP